MASSFHPQYPPFTQPTDNNNDQPLKATRRGPDLEFVRMQPPLSPTEKIVLRHLAKGMTEREAAEAMSRSHNTVHVHTRNIYRKLGVTSRKMMFRVVNAQPSLLGEQDTPQSQAA